MNRHSLSLALAVVSAVSLWACADKTVCGAGTVEAEGACVPEKPAVECGAGTTLVGGDCVPESTTTCGAGTVLQNGQCVPASTITCGAGTVEQNGACVPSGPPIVCGAGTKLQNGACLPDGTVLCRQGTAFSSDAGECVVDPSACAAGTVLLAGVCVPEDASLTADLEEAAEPNDTTGAGSLNVPAMNTTTTLHGCVTPSGGTADEDFWIMTAPGPTVLEITADGVGGLAAAFVVIASGNPALSNYQRIGLNFTGDTSRRQVFLPVAGTYALLMTDSRAVLTGGAAGSATSCYFTSIKQIAMPSATALTLPQTQATDDGNVKRYSYTPGADGAIFDVGLDTTSQALQPAFILIKNGTFHRDLEQTSTGYAATRIGGLTASDTFEIVVDPAYDYGLTPQPFTIVGEVLSASPLPTTGSTVTLTRANPEPNLLWFDALAGDVLHFNLTSSVAVTMRIVHPDTFPVLAAIVSAPRTTLTGEYVRFKSAGRYYFIVQDPTGTAGQTFTITSTVTRMTVSPLSYGTAATAQTLGTGNSSFYSLDVTSQQWMELGVTATDFGATARVSLYDLAGEGWLATSGGSAGSYPIVQSGAQPASGVAPLGRIVLGDARDYLIRVQPVAAPGPSPQFDLLSRDRPFINLGTLTTGTPIVRTNTDTTAAGGVTRYLLSGTAGHRLSVTATPTDGTTDISVQRRSADETAAVDVNQAGAGAAETLGSLFTATPNFIAFSVTNLSTTTPTNLSLNLTSTAPLPFVDICASGTTLPAPFDGSGDDDFSAVQTLPVGFTFNFFGAAKTDFIVAANGILSFGNTAPTCSFGCFSNGTIPSTAVPNDLLAPYWDDLENVKVCRKDGASTVTLQWNGNLYSSPTTRVEFQAVLHSTGEIDFIYGPNHAATGSSATIGAEGAGGAAGKLFSFNAPGNVQPSSSITFTTP